MPMDFATVFTIVITVGVAATVLLIFNKKLSAPQEFSHFQLLLEQIKEEVKQGFSALRKEMKENSVESRQEIVGNLKTNREEVAQALSQNRAELGGSLKNLQDSMLKNFSENINSQKIEFKEIRGSVEQKLNSIREVNETKLNEIRQTVDEKLQTTLEKRLGESFKQVSDRLELVHKGLGEMQTIATGVGDLKKVLSNVKTRGTLGEYQLKAILEQVLTPEQYAENVAVKKGSQARVEFAVQLPGKDKDESVWIPIDSKFPIADYEVLIDAFEVGDKPLIESSQRDLVKKIELFAKSISEKYIDPPHTTDFAIMFLPVEGLYAEVLRHPQLFESLQRKYKITVTGPTTLSAFLNSLRMGFTTLAVQRRSSEVWNILKSVKAEFGKFSEVFDKVQKQLHTASGTLDSLKTTRADAIYRKLKNVEALPSAQKQDPLSLAEAQESSEGDSS